MRIPRPFALCAFLCALAAVILAALVLRPVVTATLIRDEMRRLRAGSFSVERLNEWATSHAGTVACAGSKCEASVSLSSRPLSVLGLTPLTYFDASIVTIDGKLIQTSLRLSDLRYATHPRGATTQLLVDFSDSGTVDSNPGASRVHVGQEPIGKPPAVVYVVASNSDAKAIALAYDINLWCLARVGGCAETQQAPKVWALRKR